MESLKSSAEQPLWSTLNTLSSPKIEYFLEIILRKCDSVNVLRIRSCSLAPACCFSVTVVWVGLSVLQLQLLEHTPGSALQNLIPDCCVLTQELGFGWLLVGKHI